MKIEANSIEELFSKSIHKDLLEELDKFITSEFPTLPRALFTSDSINLVSYGVVSYKDSHKREVKWPLVGLAPQKNNVSIYFSGEKNGSYVLDSYREFFPKSALGKGCLRIRNSKGINYDILRNIINDCIVWDERR